MARYHLNPKTGEPGPCRAMVSCPYGNLDTDHYDSVAEARSAYEASQVSFEPGLKTSAAETTAARFFDANVTAYADELEFDDNSALEENYCTLAEMRDPSKALNNCFSASSAIVEELASEVRRDGGELDLKTVTFEDESPHHAVRYAGPDGVGVVVDYTARQYDEALPFPLVLEEAKWEALIARKAHAKFGIRFKRPAWATAEEARAGLEARYPGVEVQLRTRQGGYVVLDGLRVPKGDQKQGLGTQVMEDLIATADEQGWKLALTPSTDWGASSRARLERFYRRFGFVPNKGRHKDFTTMEAMVRPAQ